MIDRLQGRYRDVMARFFFKHTLCIESPVPLISFTFDDFPRSALLAGGAILESFGYRGTFYASMGEMGNDSEVGEIFRPDDLTLLIPLTTSIRGEPFQIFLSNQYSRMLSQPVNYYRNSLFGRSLTLFASPTLA
jgi:hypothetical protein